MRRVLLGIVLTLFACGKGGEKAAEGTGEDTGAPPAAGEPAAPAGSATISGTVKFTGAAPANPVIDMSEEAECKAKHSGTITDPEVVVSDGKLANVFVYVKGGIPAGQKYPVPAASVVIDQDGCLYKPRVFGIMVGQKLEIRNSDPVLHNIKAVPSKNRGFNISQPTKGMKTTRTFSTEEIMVPLECNVHSWMNAFVGVLNHPFYATSSNDGAFTIKGLPAGTYELEAKHEKLGTKTASVTVTDGGTGTAEFTFAAGS